VPKKRAAFACGKRLKQNPEGVSVCRWFPSFKMEFAPCANSDTKIRHGGRILVKISGWEQKIPA
jgi:hypothetical protein